MVNSPSSQPAVAMEPKRRPRTNQTTVSVNFDDADPLTPHRSRSSMKFEVAECIETKTVTTTTTTKRSYPPFLLKDSKPLSSLDSKEYPLAQKPTPPELANFTFNLDHEDVASWPGNVSSEQQPTEVRPCVGRPRAPLTSNHAALQSQQSTSDESTQEIKIEPGLEMSQDEGDFRTGPRNSAEKLARRFRKMDFQKIKTRSNSPVVSGSIKKSSQRTSKSHSQSLSHAVSDKLRRSLGSLSRKDRDKEIAAGKLSGGLPVTPDTSEVSLVNPDRSLRARRSHLDSFETPDSDPNESQQSFFELSSPTGSDSHTIFDSNVATPPVTDADAEPLTDADESLQQSIRALHHPRPIDTLAAQDASLPSPRLSPTLQAARLHADEPEGEDDDDDALLLHGGSQMTTMDDESAMSNALVELPPRAVEPYDGSRNTVPNLMDSRVMLETFDCMPPEMKSFMMYQFLRRCSRKTLHVVAKVVNPALKCDILKDLPLELSLHVLSYLDHRDLCRAAQVSTHWRNLIDSNETGWKALFDRDGFVLTTGELERAIKEGWGWQDPVGPEGCERDYSLQNRLTSSESELLRSSSKPEPPQKLRSSKRKRAIMTGLGSDRSKRRASAQDHVRDEKTHAEFKPEGPISAANAAALAVPDPLVGLASLRKLHLFKSLYRRHHMIRQSWTTGKVKPSHVAFAAHPRHVITCLQFDEDKIITGSDDQLIHVYDTNTGKLRKRLEGHEGGVWALQYQGNVLVSGSTDRSVRVWDIEKGLCTQVFYGHTSTVRCLQILMPTDTGKVENGVPVMMPPKPLIITGSRDSQLRVWRLPEAGSRRYIQTGPPANDADCPYFIRTLQGHSHSVRAIAAHADTLVSGSYDNTVRVWKISTGETVHVLQGHAQKVYSVVLDTERNRCISGSMDSFVKIWDLETGACTHTLEGHSLLVGLLDLRDERLVSAAADSTLRIWDPESGRCRHTLTAHTGAITCFQHDGRKVISGSDRTLKMWDIRTGECVQDLLTDLSGVWQVRFDERRCVAAVQREGITYVEILDFGAVRDGKSPEELGKRILLNAPEVQRFLDEARDDN